MRHATINCLALLMTLAGCSMGKHHGPDRDTADYVRSHPSGDASSGQADLYQASENEGFREHRLYSAPRSVSRSNRIDSSAGTSGTRRWRVASYPGMRSAPYAHRSTAPKDGFAWEQGVPDLQQNGVDGVTTATYAATSLGTYTATSPTMYTAASAGALAGEEGRPRSRSRRQSTLNPWGPSAAHRKSGDVTAAAAVQPRLARHRRRPYLPNG